MIAIKDMEMPSCCAKCYTKGLSRLADCILFNDCHSLIERNPDCPLVEIEERKGKWIGEEEGYYSECSCCGASFLWEDYKCIGDWKYCPKCGAEMTKE